MLDQLLRTVSNPPSRQPPQELGGTDKPQIEAKTYPHVKYATVLPQLSSPIKFIKESFWRVKYEIAQDGDVASWREWGLRELDWREPVWRNNA